MISIIVPNTACFVDAARHRLIETKGYKRRSDSIYGAVADASDTIHEAVHFSSRPQCPRMRHHSTVYRRIVAWLASLRRVKPILRKQHTIILRLSLIGLSCVLVCPALKHCTASHDGKLQQVSRAHRPRAFRVTVERHHRIWGGSSGIMLGFVAIEGVRIFLYAGCLPIYNDDTISTLSFRAVRDVDCRSSFRSHVRCREIPELLAIKAAKGDGV